jgi:nucleoside-diphosphate-sugar epimerase
MLTGASGFIGRQLLQSPLARGRNVVATSRSRVELPGIFYVPSPELGPEADWGAALDGADTVVHLAARAHVLGERSGHEVDALYDRVNTEGTAQLARQAVAAGVKHFVFVSSIGAVCEESKQIVNLATKCNPTTPYGRSKLKAELALRAVADAGGMEWTIVRPPLVYGPGNPGNMERLLKLIRSGIPLPLASVRNRRSFIYVENLVDLIVTCLGNPKAFGKIYLPSDGEDLSTPELIRAIARANAGVEHGAGSVEHGGKSGDSVGVSETSHTFGRRGDPSPLRSGSRHPARLFPFPPSLLNAAGRLPGLGALRKLTSSLYIDSGPIRRDLGWTPLFRMDEGLRRTLAS